MILYRAQLSDLPRLLRFRTDAAAWLSAIGTDQWTTTFPAEHVAQSIEAGEVFVLKESPAADLAATITLDAAADPLLWTEEERSETAFYVHKLTVDRRYKGLDLGVRLLDWAGDTAARQGAAWLRLDAWTTNRPLQDYYRRLGFTHIRTVDDPEVGGSGWVAQRPARMATFNFTDHTGRPKPGRHSARD